MIGGHLARAQGEADAVADAIRDHYKPVGQGDDVPTAPVTVAVSLADKLDTLAGFFLVNERPTGSKDPFALRRAAVAVIALLNQNQLRLPLHQAVLEAIFELDRNTKIDVDGPEMSRAVDAIGKLAPEVSPFLAFGITIDLRQAIEARETGHLAEDVTVEKFEKTFEPLMIFLADRLKVQQREAGVRHDLIDAVFALGGEDDLVRLLARVRALQSFVETPEGANLLAGYKRAANILKKEGYTSSSNLVTPAKAGVHLPDTSQAGSAEMDSRLRGNDEAVGVNAEEYLQQSLDAAEPRAALAVENEDFGDAMTALASLRAPIDTFFTGVMVNDPDSEIRARRLALLARFRDAVHTVADFSKIEG